MKNFSFILSVLFFSLLFTSCRGCNGKRVATEAAEFVEKKASKYIERESKAFEDEESSALRTYKNKRRADRIRDNIDNLLEEDEEEYVPQQTIIQCPQCNGGGIVYVVDAYGNIVTDYYGNAQTMYCPNCQGQGRVVVYQ